VEGPNRPDMAGAQTGLTQGSQLAGTVGRHGGQARWAGMHQEKVKILKPS